MGKLLTDAATICLIGNFLFTVYRLRSGRLRPGKTNLISLTTAFVLLSASLWMGGKAHGSCPINNLPEVLVFTAWSTILTYLVVGPAFRLSLLGAFTTPLVLALLLSARWLSADLMDPTAKVARDPWIDFHASLSLIAYGAFALAGLAGLMYLIQDRQLKKRKGGNLLYNLPPITDLGIANTRLIHLGMVLLTAAFAAGFASGMHVNSLKFWVSAAIWIFYAVLIVLRQIHSLAPKRTALLSLAALGFIMLTLPAIQHLSTHK